MLSFDRYRDPVIDRIGYPVRGDYVELCWLPIVGPSAVWVLRRLDALLDLHGGHVAVPCDELAADMGLGVETSNRRRLLHTLTRLDRFGLMHKAGDTWLVPSRLPALSAAKVARLTPSMQAAHRAFEDARIRPVRSTA